MKVARIEIAGPMKSRVFLENGEHIEGLTFISSEVPCDGLTKFKIEGWILPRTEPVAPTGIPNWKSVEISAALIRVQQAMKEIQDGVPSMALHLLERVEASLKKFFNDEPKLVRVPEGYVLRKQSQSWREIIKDWRRRETRCR